MKEEYQIKQRNLFSEEIRKQDDSQVERCELTAAQAVREYSVCKQTIYNWLLVRKRIYM